MPVPITTKTPIKDGAYKPDYETLRKTYWLYCRHTSVTYIARMVEMLEAFTKGFEAYIGTMKGTGEFPGFLRCCWECLADHKVGLALLRTGDSAGFKLIRGAMSFREPFDNRPDEYTFDLLGRKKSGLPGEGLWAWMEKIISMCMQIDWALCGKLAYPRFDVTNFKFPAQIGGYPLGENIFIKDGYSVPTTGVWQPISLKGGCPNFLIKGQLAPKARIPILREETPAWHDNVKHYTASTDFEYGEFPTQWQLMWEDDRWRNKREPVGEEEYIEGPDTQFPKDLPLAPRDLPKNP